MTLENEEKLENLLTTVTNRVDDRHLSINDLIKRYIQLVQTPSDLVVVGPILNSLLQIDVKNDEHLVKLAALIQRAIISTSPDDPSDEFGEEEKMQLLHDIKHSEEKID